MVVLLVTLKRRQKALKKMGVIGKPKNNVISLSTEDLALYDSVSCTYAGGSVPPHTEQTTIKSAGKVKYLFFSIWASTSSFVVATTTVYLNGKVLASYTLACFSSSGSSEYFSANQTLNLPDIIVHPGDIFSVKYDKSDGDAGIGFVRI